MDLRHWEWAYLKQACNSFQLEFRKPNSSAHGVRYTPDGKRIACGYGDGTIRVWDIATGEFQQLGNHSAAILCLDFNEDGSKLASTAGDHVNKNFGEIKLWDLSNGQELMKIDTGNALVSSIDFSPDGKSLAIASWNSTIRLLDLETKSEKLLKEHRVSIKAICYSRDGQLLASGDWNGLVVFGTLQLEKSSSG